MASIGISRLLLLVSSGLMMPRLLIRGIWRRSLLRFRLLILRSFRIRRLLRVLLRCLVNRSSCWIVISICVVRVLCLFMVCLGVSIGSKVPGVLGGGAP